MPSAAAAGAVAHALHIDAVHSGLLPADKVQLVQQMQRTAPPVAEFPDRPSPDQGPVEPGDYGESFTDGGFH